VADQVSPLGNLGTGSPIPALPAARAVAVQSGSTSVNANSSSADPAVLAKPAAHPSAKAAEVNPQAINAQLQQANSSLQFKVDKSTGISYFKIVDSTTGKVIRQVPSEDVLAMAQKLQDFSSHQNSSGILMDQKG
jgi:flagellar protein FlaG